MSVLPQRIGRGQDREWVEWHCKRCLVVWSGNEDFDACPVCENKGQLGHLEGPECSCCGREANVGETIVEATTCVTAAELADADWMVDGEGELTEFTCMKCIDGDNA